MLEAGYQIGDNSLMARRIRTPPPKSGLYHAREARRMSRSELVRLSGVSKQQLSRLENGLIRLRLDHLKPFAGPLGFTPEQILLWGRYPGTGGMHIESSDVLREEPGGRRVQLFAYKTRWKQPSFALECVGMAAVLAQLARRRAAATETGAGVEFGHLAGRRAERFVVRRLLAQHVA